MKWAIGIAGAFFFFYFCAPFLFRAMAKHDYDTLYYGIRDAKKAAGSYVQEEDRPFISYADDYAHGRN